MATTMKRPRRPAGQAFYTTALVVSLFAVYSLLRSTVISRDARHENTRVFSRSLDKRDEECRYVHRSQDHCTFVRNNCPDEEAGLMSYLQLYYCSLAKAQPIAFIILVLWISLLFSTIGIAASDFLCINLSTIASVLGMSESLTGVTFLAFGNGSPDVFSTFAAMSTHSGSLAVGELMGAAGFITAVVAGSMALVKPFNVARKSFVRDVGFFTVAAGFSLVFLADGNLRLWECAAMVGFYLFYVVFVVTWHWWLTRRRTQRLRETTARLHHHIPHTQELEVPDIEDDEDGRAVGERQSLLRGNSGDSYASLTASLEAGEPPAWKLEEIDDDDQRRDRYLAELRSNMRVSRQGRGERRNTITPIRPSLIGALEFRAILNSLEKKGTKGSTTNIHLRRYSDDPSFILGQASDAQSTTSVQDRHTDLATSTEQQNALLHASNHGIRNRAVSANDATSLRIDTQFLDVPGRIPENAITSLSSSPSQSSQSATHQRKESQQTDGSLTPPPRSPQLFISPPSSMHHSDPPQAQTPPSDETHLMPFNRPNYRSSAGVRSPEGAKSPMTRGLEIPRLELSQPDQSKSLLGSPFPAYMDSPGVITPIHSRPPSLLLPAASMSPESVPAQYQDSEDELFVYKWWPYAYAPAPEVIISSLFPTLYGWKTKGVWDKLLGLVTAPSIFLLTITLPVVESEGERNSLDPDPGLLTPGPGLSSRSRSASKAQLPPDSLTATPHFLGADAPPHPHHGHSRQNSSYFPKSLEPDVTSLSSPKDWNRWLVILQVFTAPQFVVFIVWANLDDTHGAKTLVLLTIASLIFSLCCLFIILGLTDPDRSPKYRPLFCFLGFAVAIAWISTIANEVVGVLKALGVILGISDAILGLTIFAVGNSLGDLVADITVAKLGFPVMALSACFGGPMLNILLGIGISGMYMTLQKGEKKHHKHPNRPIQYKPFEIEVSTTLMISGVTLLITLVGLLVVVPLNGWRMDRKIGWGLIGLWCVSTIGNVVVEVLGIGTNWDA